MRRNEGTGPDPAAGWEVLAELVLPVVKGSVSRELDLGWQAAKAIPAMIRQPENLKKLIVPTDMGDFKPQSRGHHAVFSSIND